jgi:hypothetical protein
LYKEDEIKEVQKNNEILETIKKKKEEEKNKNREENIKMWDVQQKLNSKVQEVVYI